MRLEVEDRWIKNLRTIYPYGLNDRAKKNCSLSKQSVGHLFPPLPRNSEKQNRTRNRGHVISPINLNDFFQKIYSLLDLSIKTSMNFTRMLLNKTKKNILKRIASKIINKESPCQISDENEQFHQFILDIIDTKLYKPQVKVEKKPPENVLSIYFHNKGLEDIRLPRILHNPKVKELLPENLRCKEKIPVVVFKLSPTIRHKILNYKEVVNSINISRSDISSVENMSCECAESEFCDPHHRHIITGDLSIIKNNKLRKLFSKGPNYRERTTTNYSKALKLISSSLDNIAIDMCKKYKLEHDSLKLWKDKIKELVNKRIDELKQHTKINLTNNLLKDQEILNYLSTLQEKYVIVTIDKASNNFAFICKKFYIQTLLKEVDFLENKNDTYKVTERIASDIIDTNIEFCKKYNLKVPEEHKTLPIMYWTPKMHKNPIGHRFIIASSRCSTKVLSKEVSKAFKLIFKQIQSFHDKSKFYSNYKKFWVVENSTPVIEKIKKLNQRNCAKSISTYDFTTLYTTLEHDNLLKDLKEIIDFVFSAGKSKYISYFGKTACWTNRKDNSFSKSSLKAAITHLISECYFTIGDHVLAQTIGIPMGIDPAPFWANLYLYKYEKKHITSLIKKDKKKAFCYNGSFRFIDDLCSINDNNELSTSITTIYPPELSLKVEHSGNHATFLDLDITISNNKFIYKLFDKRDAFPFFIVRMPYLCSNIPSFIFYGTFMSEVLRIARNTLLYEDFKPKASSLFNRMINQGGNKLKLASTLSKLVNNHSQEFIGFGVPSEQIIVDVENNS